MLKKINITIFILILIAVSNICADDGSWNPYFTIGGSIYSESDNMDIELTKEILIFNGEYTRAVFQFKNTSNRAATIICGFPIRYEIFPDFIVDEYVIARLSKSPIPAVDYLETKTVVGEDPEEREFGKPQSYILVNSFNNSREFISPEETPEDLTFSIKQNGENVEIDKVLLERYAGEGGAWVTFHYRHNLDFKPGEVSTVVVEYHQDLYHGLDGQGGFAYLWNYGIGTGGTWKGPIGEFILMKPAIWWPTDWSEKSIEGVNLILEGRDITVFRAVDYEPEREAAFSLSGRITESWMGQYEYYSNKFEALKKMINDRSRLAYQPAYAVQSFVTDITASSWLSDKISVFTNDGVIEKANFSPIAAFDGLTETSWCENVKGDGIGQYLEFSLTERVWGISINNGFTRLPLKDEFFEPDKSGYSYSPFEKLVWEDLKVFKDYFTLNNRIKKLSVTNQAGDILYTIELNDQRNRQTFAGISLSPGTYRLVIEEVYRGTKWQDTCLAEVTFLEAGINTQMNRFTADQFYMEALRGVLYK